MMIDYSLIVHELVDDVYRSMILDTLNYVRQFNNYPKKEAIVDAQK